MKNKIISLLTIKVIAAGIISAQTINFFDSDQSNYPIVVEQSFIVKEGSFHNIIWLKKIVRYNHRVLLEEYYGIPNRKVDVVQATEIYNDSDIVGFFIDEQYYFNGKKFFDEDGIEVKLEELDFINWVKFINVEKIE